VEILKRAGTAATLCCNHQRYYQPRLHKGRMLRFRKLHLTIFQAGDAINIFASVKKLTLTTAMLLLLSNRRKCTRFLYYCNFYVRTYMKRILKNRSIRFVFLVVVF